MNFVVNCLQDFQFKSLDLADIKFLMSNLVVNGLHLEWIDIFILAGNEHASHANQMQIVDFFLSLHVLQISVLQVDSQKVGLVVTLEVSQHLNHPVRHSSPKLVGDTVVTETVRNVNLLLVHSQVSVDVNAQLIFHIQVLSIKISG